MSYPKFSIIVPVLHERKRINELIERLNRLDSEKSCEIIVVDGAQERNTLEAIHTNDVVKISSKKGRARQMNAGASVARGKILVFLHADTDLPIGALKKMDAVAERGYMAGAFDLGIRSDKLIFKIISFLGSLRSRLNRIPYGDQAIFIRREYFKEIGGYKEIPLMEDIDLMRRIKRSGKKIWILYDRVMTSPRRWEREGIVYCTLRNWILQILYFLGISPDRLAKFYKSEGQKGRRQA